MNDRFGPSAAGNLSQGDRRRRAASKAGETGWPSTETEEWRYSPIGDLTLDQLAPATAEPTGSAPDLFVSAVPDRAATVVVLDGWVVDISVESGWVAKGLEITANDSLVATPGSDELTVFDLLHQAFSPAAVHIRVPKGLSVREPIVIVNHHVGIDVAAFPHIVVEADEDSDVAVVERQTSEAGLALSVPVVELRAAAAARLRYQTIQELDRSHWQLARQASSVASQATVVSGVATFGARYGRLRVDSRLTGRGASGQLIAAYYGDGDQIHDFRIFQHHDAGDTRSDLLFKGAQDDSSGSIYTGLIHVHPAGAGTNAFQTNRNVKLSPEAWAWSVPNLEIENNDVHCSHASTVSPVDGDQQFYLGSRGVPPVVADRLIVAGFFDEVINRMPVEEARSEVRRQISEKLDRRDAS